VGTTLKHLARLYAGNAATGSESLPALPSLAVRSRELVA
jgi:hypothetical protein